MLSLFISTFSGRKWIVASWIKTFWSCSYGCQVRDHNHLTIISAYQVCQTTIKNVGLKTNTMQQWQRLEEKNLEDKNIRELMIRDLANFINNLQQHKYEVIVEIDSNESNDQPKNRVDTLLHFTKLIDIISQQHGIKKEPNTRLSGSKCIEFVLCSKHISIFIDKCGITLFNEIKFSDHRGLFLDLHLTSFLKNNASHCRTIIYILSNLPMPKSWSTTKSMYDIVSLPTRSSNKLLTFRKIYPTAPFLPTITTLSTN